MKHLDAIRTKVSRMSPGSPPHPWRRIANIAVGGLTAVGFDPVSELLLVVSAQGRGVIDAARGERVARDSNEYFEDAQHLEAEGIGPLAGAAIRIAGLAGGGLPQGTADGWSIELMTIEGPIAHILLFPPGSSLHGAAHGMPDIFTKLASESELRAAGFSASGRSLVVATSSDVAIFGRSLEGART